MNGIENIEKKILDEAKAKADAIIKEANEKASSIHLEYEEKTKSEITLINEKNVLLLQDIRIKAKQADGMDRKKRIASEKQSIIKMVFAKALEELLNLNDEDYFALLVKLAKEAMSDKMGGELLFNERDRAKFGQKVVDTLNSEVIGDKVSAAKKVVSTAVDNLMEGNIPNVGEIAQQAKKGFSGQLVTLACENAPIAGGLVVRRGKIEFNCDVAVLIRILSEDFASEVSDRLFPKGA